MTQLAHRILTSSLLVSLESSAPVGYTALPFVGEELASEGLEPLLTSEQFERALVARLSLPSNTSSSETAIEYLLATYTRLQTHKKRLLSLSSNSADKEKVEERVAIVDRAVEVLLRWGVLVLDREMQGVMVVQNARWAFRVVVRGWFSNSRVLFCWLGHFPAHITLFISLPLFAASRGAEDGPAVLLDLLLANSLPQTFLEELAASAQSSESLPGLITPILVALAARFRALPPLGSGASPYPPLLGALQSLLAVKPIAATTPTLPAFNPPVPSKTIELVSLLGPYFSRLTPFPDTDPTVGSNLFASSTYGISDRAEVDEQGVPWRGRNAGEVKMAWLNLRSVLSSLEGSHHGLLLSLYRANRPATTTWILRILTENAARGKMQFDPLQVSSHGFMYALYRSHLKLCDPFAEGLTKVNGPDPIPLFSDEAWAGIAGETRIVSDKSGADAYAAELRAGDRGEASFVTSVFHTTLSFAHLGPLSTIRIYTAQLRDIGELSRHVARLTRERDSGAWDNPAGELQKAMLKRFEGQLDKMIGEKLASDAALLDPEFLRHVLRFLDFQMAWLVRVAVESCGGNTQGVDWNAVMRGEVDKVGGVELANMGEPSGRWTCLPEWVLDDVCEWYTFITQWVWTR